MEFDRSRSRFFLEACRLSACSHNSPNSDSCCRVWWCRRTWESCCWQWYDAQLWEARSAAVDEDNEHPQSIFIVKSYSFPELIQERSDPNCHGSQCVGDQCVPWCYSVSELKGKSWIPTLVSLGSFIEYSQSLTAQVVQFSNSSSKLSYLMWSLMLASLSARLNHRWRDRSHHKNLQKLLGDPAIYKGITVRENRLLDCIDYSPLNIHHLNGTSVRSPFSQGSAAKSLVQMYNSVLYTSFHVICLLLMVINWHLRAGTSHRLFQINLDPYWLKLQYCMFSASNFLVRLPGFVIRVHFVSELWPPHSAPILRGYWTFLPASTTDAFSEPLLSDSVSGLYSL